jgi:hypothetical protein
MTNATALYKIHSQYKRVFHPFAETARWPEPEALIA